MHYNLAQLSIAGKTEKKVKRRDPTSQEQREAASATKELFDSFFQKDKTCLA